MIHRLMVRAVVTGGLLAAWLQPTMAPPMRLGLWEVTTTTAMKMPGQQASAPARTMKIRSCATADSWSKAFGGTRTDHGCKVVNEQRTPTHYSFDLSCAGNGMKGHGEMDFGAGTQGHGMMHMDIMAGGNAMVVDTTWTSKYLGADCGSITPGAPQIVQ